jgi:dTDP-4-dehydrorhamnose reductase
MNIAVLGSGFIGGYIAEYLGTCRSRYLDNLHILTKVTHNYDQPGVLSRFINEHSIDTVINTCGYTGYPNVDACEENKKECFYYNVKVPLVIENECKVSDKKAQLIHVSSGCIYTGYDKDYTEEDTPNFGLYNDEASFYSKTKHLSELLLDLNFTNILRIRMPISAKFEHKNLLNKLYNYNNIIDYKNSKTDVLKLCQLIAVICENFTPGIYNAVHSNTLSTKQVTGFMEAYGICNKKWKFIPYKELPIKANRSNCILDNSKLRQVFDFDFGDESVFIKLNCSLMQNKLKCPEKE